MLLSSFSPPSPLCLHLLFASFPTSPSFPASQHPPTCPPPLAVHVLPSLSTSSLERAALDDEDWRLIYVSSKHQQMVNRVCGLGGWNESVVSAEDVASLCADRRPDGLVVPSGVDLSTAPQTALMVVGRSHRVVYSTVVLEAVLGQLLECAQRFPSIASNVLEKLRDVLSSYNTRVHELVLKCKAMKVKGLTSISTKHLALASQSLGVVISQIPTIRASIAAHLPRKRHALLGEMDKVSRAFEDHRERIFDKFVAIVKSMLETVCAEVPQLRWDEPLNAGAAQVSNPPANRYMNVLAGNTERVHRVLSQILPAEQLMEVFMRIAGGWRVGEVEWCECFID